MLGERTRGRAWIRSPARVTGYRLTGAAKGQTSDCRPQTRFTPSACWSWSPPPTERGRRPANGFYSHARERLRILGELPLRKFDGGNQPSDPDGNPDTSFLA